MRALLPVLLLTSCLAPVDYAGKTCPDGTCPDGLRCIAGVCRQDGAAGGGAAGGNTAGGGSTAGGATAGGATAGGATAGGATAGGATAGGATAGGATAGGATAGGATAGGGTAGGATAGGATAGGATAGGATAGGMVTPIAFEQERASDTMGVAGTTVAVTLSNAVKAGSTLVVVVSTGPPTDGAVQVTDTLGSTFTLVAGPRLSDSSSNNLRAYAAFNVTAGADTVTINLVGASAGSHMELYVTEYSGVQSLETSVSNVGAGTVPDIVSGFLNTTGSNVLLFAMCLSGGSASPLAPFTQRTGFNSNFTADRIVTAPGMYQATGTNNSGSEWTILLSAFRGF